MIQTDDVFSISVLVTCIPFPGAPAQEIVPFKVFRKEQHFKAVPLLALADRARTGLPEVLCFAFVNGYMIPEGPENEATLEVMRNMIWELSIQEVLEVSQSL